MDENISFETEDNNGSSAARLPLDLLRPCVRLMGKVAVQNTDLIGKKRMLMDGLCELLHCEMWFWFLSRNMFNEYEPSILGLLDGGVDQEVRESFIRASTDLENPDPSYEALKALSQSGQKLVAVDRSRLLSDEEWYCSGHYLKYREPVGIDHYVGVVYPVTSEITSVVGMHRGINEPCFSDDELAILQLMFTEIDWLHSDQLDQSHGEQVMEFTPREREVFLYLSTGLCRKDIANTMELSIHTVNDYVKQVYEKYSVSSQSALISKVYFGVNS